VEVSQQPPEGTIALLFTDIEGSTRLAARLGPAWGAVLAEHHALVGGAIAAEGGFVDGTEGDSLFATFHDATAAARAAVGALRALKANSWPQQVGALEVRMGLHVGHVERAATGYVGLEVHRAARVAAAAHGGQLLLTDAARGLVGETVTVEPLGVHRLKDFPKPEALFCAVVDGRGAAAFPPLRTEQLRPTNLPAGLPVLVGRESDLERVRDALIGDADRLVTLTGRGGVGKTSLALTAATEMLDQHPGGVWLVTLATVTSPAEVLAAVASAVGAEGEMFDSPREAIVARLRGRGPTLLVIDNLEHLLVAAPDIAALLDELPDLRALVTSQAPLRLTTERCVPLDALDDASALALMERVAERRGAESAVQGTHREVLVEVAHLLDGLPLALELAAARLMLLSPEQLLERLRGSSAVLEDVRGGRPERQRSLRATVDWTLGLLEARPRELFTRLGTFAGPVELEDLEIVLADGLDVLNELGVLLDVALVRRVESGDGRVRFGLPEALRQIAATLLDGSLEGQRWRRAHAQRQYELTWPARTSFVSQAVYRAAMAADVEAAAALGWARASGDPLAGALGAGRGALLVDVGRVREARSVLAPLLAHPSGDAAIDSSVLSSNAIALYLVGLHEEAKAAAEEAIALAPDTLTRAWALRQRSILASFAGELDVCLGYSERARELAAELGPEALCAALVIESQACHFVGEIERSARILDEAERIGGPVEAQCLVYIETLRADVDIRSGRLHEALEHYARSMESAQAREDPLQIANDLAGVAKALALLREDGAALEVVGVGEAQGQDLSGLDSFLYLLAGEHALADAEARLGYEMVAEAKARGHAVPSGNRVTRACQLARAHRLTERSTGRATGVSRRG
jgi:predicted ATPase/class 3 adenylate cyclase